MAEPVLAATMDRHSVGNLDPNSCYN